MQAVKAEPNNYQSDPREDMQRENVVSYLSLSPTFATVAHDTGIAFYM
ncbi:hypothetical protein LEMLEM_LOCUS16958, partial [Lemmus lemmus]